MLKLYITALARPGVSVDLHVDGEAALQPKVQRHLLLIARELLSNALNHANARHISVLLESRVDRVLLRVEDDGVGFDPSAGLGKQGSLGLKGVRHRVEHLSGKLDINSQPASGCVTTIEIPIGEQNA